MKSPLAPGITLRTTDKEAGRRYLDACRDGSVIDVLGMNVVVRSVDWSTPHEVIHGWHGSAVVPTGPIIFVVEMTEVQTLRTEALVLDDPVYRSPG